MEGTGCRLDHHDLDPVVRCGMLPRRVQPTTPDWPALIAPWAETWGLPGLEHRLEVQVSTRLRTTLGRCVPARGQLRIAAFLLEAPEELLHEVLCHEAAHAAAHERHGPRIRPHGREWRLLMTEAGFTARARFPAESLAALPDAARRARVLWEHRCPTCHVMQRAGRPVKEWRCTRCRSAGLPGRLRITRLTAAAP
jgi:predicted SprT family Zn-dependent metalloprotease